MDLTKRYINLAVLLAVVFAAAMICGCTGQSNTDNPSSGSVDENDTITVTDSLGREVTVPKDPDSVVCSGSGCLRYLTYLGAQDKIVGVDDIEIKDQEMDARPYALANTQFKNYPLIGEYRGNDDPEKIVALNPEVIFKAGMTSADEADELSEKTGIPVVGIDVGSLSTYRDDMYYSFRLMGKVIGKEDRAEELINYFNASIADLNDRTAGVSNSDKISTYVGGIAYRGPHGFQSTEPAYPPFVFVNANNVAASMGTDHADVAKEKILEWDPEVIFVDLSTLQTTDSNAVTELRNDDSYSLLSAVKADRVYGVLPYNWYSQNQGSILADAYYVGKVLYPEKFSDINPDEKADEIYTFLVGGPVFDELNETFGGMAFSKISV
ncbi:iron complex transport system substrate-binding protein [Methanomicrobium sp. W14]|uniref:iron ABC transporter substrate-binding protein n=1 Tax=Methanomicrobium sp. W14 TaxID=2817839 RepID=UPI001AEAA14D|nr:iron ABC transporter substrate-binding protein [Methanomicrobium sp. W14]MBP2133063.1 iron complex transport system substrate-binding protein [Methanomicrobium sp. W14]